jgi:hypothetical protein
MPIVGMIGTESSSGASRIGGGCGVPEGMQRGLKRLAPLLQRLVELDQELREPRLEYAVPVAAQVIGIGK